jgi:dynein heavy chain
MIEFNYIWNINNPKLKDYIKMPIENGVAALVEGIENEVDPLFDPILEKQWIINRNRIILDMGGGEKIDLDPKFQLYMTTRLSNPKFSPELAAKTTIIDFTVTQGGLEEQLLSRVLSKEQRSLEEQLQQYLEEITLNTNTLRQYDRDLLERLSNATGSLIDDL